MQKKDEKIIEDPLASNRRKFLTCFSSLGAGASLFPGALLAVARDASQITEDMVEAAAEVAGISLNKDAVEKIAEQLNGQRSLLKQYDRIRQLRMSNSVSPAFVFNPLLTGERPEISRKELVISPVRTSRPTEEDDLAFLPVTHLSQLVRSRELTSLELTKLYLERLKRFDPKLHCVVTLTEELALKQAERADAEIRAGLYRGPLHGIPWGAKDLLAVKGYRTTFGASPYREQTIDVNSTVFERLSNAGAVLVAKLSLGALAMGDRWFGGLTRSPWDWENTERGSSGSSAGPGSATAAGLVGFSIGTETRGSIISPSVRCGVTGHRPTFGRVSRHGAMALSWTMDKIGPMCRSAEDCALVLHAINGADGKDRSVVDVPFNWDATRGIRGLRVGYLKKKFEDTIKEDPERPEETIRARAIRENDLAALDTLRKIGIELIPIELPHFDVDALGFILTTEAAAAFDELTLSGSLESMSQPPEESRWVNSFRLHRFVPAIDYIQANRARLLLMEEMSQLFDKVDLFVGGNSAITNLTGHPAIAVPHGFDTKGQPTAMVLTGNLFGDEEILRVAHRFQQSTRHHLVHPNL